MTESEWLQAIKPMPLMNWLRRRASKRQLYLVGAAAARQVWDPPPGQPYRDLVQLVEEYADGLVSGKHLGRAHRAADEALFREMLGLQERGMAMLKASKRLAVAFAAVRAAMAGGGWEAACSALADAARAGKRAQRWPEQCDLLRDLFGNPFRPLVLDPALLSWNEATVPRLAQAIYDDHAWDRLPILADALEESGCADAGVLTHLRSGGFHARGCHVVDALLGKT